MDHPLRFAPAAPAADELGDAQRTIDMLRVRYAASEAPALTADPIELVDLAD